MSRWQSLRTALRTASHETLQHPSVIAGCRGIPQMVFDPGAGRHYLPPPPSHLRTVPYEAMSFTPSLRLRVTLAFLVCNTAVLGVLDLVADRQLTRRLVAERDRQVDIGLNRLARVLQEPAWTLNRQQLNELLTAEIASNVHLAWVSVNLLGDDQPLIISRDGHQTDTLTVNRPQLSRALLQPTTQRQIGTLAASSDDQPLEATRTLRRHETLVWIVVLDSTLALLAWAVMGHLVNRRLDPLARRLAAAPEAAARAAGDELERVAAGADALLTRLATVLDAISDGVVTIDGALMIERCNPAAHQLLGAGARTGRPLSEALAAHPGAAAVLELIHERVLTRGESVAPTGTHTLNGRQVTVSVSPLAAGGAVLVLRDLTEQLATADRLQQALRLESIGRLAGGIAHDSNNLLTVIVGAAELLARSTDSTIRRRHTGTILNTANQAADFNRKLLAFARKDPVRRDVLDLRAVVTEAETLLKHSLTKHIELLIDMPAEPLVINGDRTALVNALLNLGVNARDAMPEGGTLRLILLRATLNVAEEATGGGTLPPGDYACLLVTDSGEGITGEHLDRMFEPFFTTKAVGRGTGLGLAAVLGTVRTHDGTITVTSPGRHQGTTFRMLLPLSNAPLPPAIPSAISGRTWRGDGTVLLIEDDAVVRMVGQKLLESLGFTVLAAANGRQGLAVHAEHQGRIRVVLLDLMMPVMGGAECFAVLHAREPQLPVIFASGFSGDTDVEQLVANGAAGWLHKPFQLDELVAVLRAALAGVPRPQP